MGCLWGGRGGRTELELLHEPGLVDGNLVIGAEEEDLIGVLDVD